MRMNIKFIQIIIIIFNLVLISCSFNDKLSNNKKDNIIDYDFSIKKNTSIDNKIYHKKKNCYVNIEQLKNNNIIYFDLDKYNIKDEYKFFLNSHAVFLRDHPYNKIIIEGNTDERGTSEYNISLGERRANSVKIYLQGKGVSEDQISIISYGKEKPAVLGHNEIAYSKNRRAVIIY